MYIIESQTESCELIMEERELLTKIDNLEKRVEALEKEISTIAKINQSERVREYISSAERARKIASLLDMSSKNEDVDDLKPSKSDLSETLLDKPEMHVLNEAKEYVDNFENNLVEEIENNNKVGNAYDWNSLFEYEENDGNITITKYIGFDDMDTVVIPDSINDYPVTNIGEEAFKNCKSIKEVILSRFLKIIQNEAFWNSGIEKIMLPASLIYIGENAFAFSKLENIQIPSNVEKISKSAFYSCSDLKEISFSEGITSIDEKAFASCVQLLKVDIPSSVKHIGSFAFYECGKDRVNRGVDIRIPNQEILFDDYAFSYIKMVFCNSGSVAMKYARKYGIPVKPYEKFDLLEE